MCLNCSTIHKLVRLWSGFFIRGILNLEMNFIAKKELFRLPFGYYFKWMGGTPPNRSKNENKVDAIASIFKHKNIFRLAIAPEGTRKKLPNKKQDFIILLKKQTFLLFR